MVYVNKDGTISDRAPFSISGLYNGIMDFLYLLLRTLFNPDYSRLGYKYTQEFRPPGSGPPKPPTRKFGGFGPSGSGPSPPPMGGGCGCGG